MKLRGLSILLATVLSLFLLIGCGDKKDTAKTESRAGVVGSKPGAYAFKLETLDGRKVALDDYKGKVLILDFWDTWCAPCRMEIPHFIELYDQYNDMGLEILGVAFGREGKDAVVDFSRQYNINYPNALASRDFIQGYGPMNSIPTTFIIDQKGNIHKKFIGYRSKEIFESEIRALLSL